MQKEITKPSMPVLIKDLGMLKPLESSKYKKRFGIFKCQCGQEFKAMSDDVKKDHTKSCGCYLNTTHGLTYHRLYHTWVAMIARTSNPKSKDFANYGARGIVVCDSWKDINNFIEDMYPTFEEGLTLDRINNNQGYSPDNCRWATPSTQMSNRRMDRRNTSGYRGVSRVRWNNKWIAKICSNYKIIKIGYFDSPADAAKAYDNYIMEHNFPHCLNFK